MIQKVKAYMEYHHMVPGNRRILAGFSGGADSLCLMEVLRRLSESEGFSLMAVHVHHGIRGESADMDEAFVRSYCQAHDIVLEVRRINVPEEAEKRGLGLEETARIMRYEVFEETACFLKAGAVAVAHHQNDQAETMLFQMARGSSLTGAGGMRPVKGRVIRPLLCLDKEEILAYLHEQGLSWREDETNGDIRYTRNYIRRELLPALTDRVNKGAVKHMALLAEELQSIESFLEKEELRLFEKFSGESKNAFYLLLPVKEEEELLFDRCIYRLLSMALGGRKDLTREHVLAVRELFFRECGCSYSLPGGVKAWREQNRVLAGRQMMSDKEEEILLFPGQSFTYAGKNYFLSLEENRPFEIPEKKYTKWLDYDKMAEKLVLRHRRAGDRICIDDAGHHKSIKQYMIDRKIPRHTREEIPLLAIGSEVVWIVGDRISADFKVNKDTKKILMITVTGE